MDEPLQRDDSQALHSDGPPTGRLGPDRRSRPTPILSRFWLRGQRRGGRREGETASIYVDRYSQEETCLILWIGGAALADLVLTLLHLAAGGGEANPVMDWFLAHGGPAAFAAAKILMTSLAALYLLLHARFRGTRPGLWGLSVMYVAVMGYHVVAYLDRA